MIITIGGVTDPDSVERTYEDIDKIFKSNPEKFKTQEVRDEAGRFKSYIVET